MGNNLNVPVKIKRLRSQAKLPAYATEGAAAMDLCAVLEAPFTLAPGQRALLPRALPLSCGPGVCGAYFCALQPGLQARGGAAQRRGRD